MTKFVRVLFWVAAAWMFSGCAQRAVVRESAKTLQHSMILYEQRLDGLITSQQKYYEARSAEYRKAHSLLLTEGGQQKIFQKAADLTDQFSENADANVNVSDLMAFLRASDQVEYDLQTQIQKDLSDKEAEFQSSLRNLERDRDTAILVRQNLGRIATKVTLKDEALQLKDFGTEVQTNLEKPKSKDDK